MKLSTRATRRSALGAVAAVGLAALATGVSVAPAFAAAAAGTLSSASGPAGGGNALTMVIPSTASPKFASGFAVSFQPKATTTTVCSANYTAPPGTLANGLQVNATSPKLLSSTKIAFTVPSQVNFAANSTLTSLAWLVCVYPGTTNTSALQANATYTIAAKPTLANSPITPASAPALGGTTVTVTGTNFITGLTAKIGTVPLTNISIAANGQSFTATVPPQAAGSALPLSVTTTGGSATKAAVFTYTNGIVIAPNTTPTATTATDVDVQGVGFSTLDFSTTTGANPDDTNAHVYLVNGAYDPTDDTNGAKTSGETGECVNVMVISDTELICTLNTAKAYDQTNDAAIANGVYTVYVVNDGRVDVQGGNTPGANFDANDPFNPTIISSGSTFTVAPY